jgi:hypothetical protein
VTARREAFFSAVAAAVVAALLAWLGPPGSDLAAHVYQRWEFLQHGFALWNNFWYAGRYSYVTYSLLYYPLAALLGIRLLAVATIATAAYAFTVVMWRHWGAAARWSSRTFGVVWAGIVLSAAFPFALGFAFALLALWALQARAHWRFALLAALTLAASPLAFLLLVVVLAGIAISERANLRGNVGPIVAVLVAGGVEAVLLLLFPGGGRYPFSTAEAAAGLAFCLLGLAFTWRVESLNVVRWFLLVYLCTSIVSYAIPSAIGENVERLRYAAVPIAVLVFSVRRWRPLVPAIVIVSLAVSWNLSPLAASYAHGESDPAAAPAYWTDTTRYLHAHLSPSFRVEAVDTVGHWPAVYLARADIPLARGWFRQDDFPQNAPLYNPRLDANAYLRWLRSLGVGYVVLTDAPPDYSARVEARLLRSGRSGLTVVHRSAHATIYAVPDPRPLVSGPNSPQVVALTQTKMTLVLPEPHAWYRIAVRWSPYWQPSAGCVWAGQDGMLRIAPHGSPVVTLDFVFSPGRALGAIEGSRRHCVSKREG